MRVIDLLIDELDERRQLKLQLQLGLLERELRLMLAVLDYIESLEGPSQDMNRWAEDARDVVRSAKDMIDSFMISTAKRSRAKVLKRFALFFNHIFLRFKLSPKVKRLMLRINDLSKESEVLNTTTDGGAQALHKYRGGAKDKAPPMRFLKTSVPRECAGFVVTYSCCLFLPIPCNPILSVPCCCLLIVGERTIPRIYHLLFKVRKQILNVRKEREVTSISSREPNTIISSLLEQIDIVLSPRYLFYSSATREVEQVRQYIKCIDNLVKDVESVRELDEREIVWLEWVSEICLPAKDFLTSFVSKREQEIKTFAKLKAPTFIGAD